jgi:hypothetical protein
VPSTAPAFLKLTSGSRTDHEVGPTAIHRMQYLFAPRSERRATHAARRAWADKRRTLCGAFSASWPRCPPTRCHCPTAIPAGELERTESDFKGGLRPPLPLHQVKTSQ